MVIEQRDIDIVTFLLEDLERRNFSRQAIEVMLHQTSIFHYLAVIQLLGKDVPKLDEMAEMISKFQKES